MTTSGYKSRGARPKGRKDHRRHRKGRYKGGKVGAESIQAYDYDEIFSSMVMLKSIQIMLAIVAYMDYEI